MSAKVKEETKPMGVISTKPIDINRFWEKTPTTLKFVLLMAIIVACSYFLVSRKVDNSQVKELTKIEQGIDVTYDLVKRFELYQTNEQTLTDVKNIYVLVQELNSNMNSKLDFMIKNSGKYNQDLVDKLILLNQSFEKLSKAYQPTEKIEMPESTITVKKIIK